MTGFDMEGSLINELTTVIANDICKHVDFEVLCKLLISHGHTLVDLEHGSSRAWVDVINWADQNCSDSWTQHNGKWLFKDERDATMFVLRWS
jgi:hypothetical protein